MTLPGWEGAVSGLSYKLFPALGAGDGDLALAPGYTYRLAALGAVKVAVLPVLQPVEELEELPVLLIALVGISGEAAPDGINHQRITEYPKNQIHRRHRKQYRQNAGGQTRAENGHIQTVCPVASGHEAPEGGCQF